MAEDEGVSSTLVRDYFMKNGGRVKRHDLFDHFRSQLDEYGDQGKLKNQFGDIVNSLAFLQSIEGEKYFVLKKNKNGATPVQLRRPPRGVYQRKEKGVSLPVSMRNFRFPSAEDSPGTNAAAENRSRASTHSRHMLKSDSLPNNRILRNNSDNSITATGLENDSGVDTAVSSVQSESPRLGGRHGSFPRGADPDQLSQHSGDTGISFGEDDQYDNDLPSHLLNGLQKSWMMSSMTGNRANIICYLVEDPNIVFFKDFVMGTALHWAAKQGSDDILRLLINGGADIHAKSGYTALHLASMHGQIHIINILIDECHVDVHIRDHSGKEAKDVLKKDSSDEIRQKLRDPAAANAPQELEKKLPGKMTPSHMKKLGKILSRKQHSTDSNVDGEVSDKIPRSPSESMGSLLDNENLVEHRDPISDDLASENESISLKSMDRRSLDDPMGSQDMLEDTRLALDAWERENVGVTVE